MSDKKEKKVGKVHKRLQHHHAKYVRALPIHLKHTAHLPKIAHLTLGGKFRNRRSSAKSKWYPEDDVKKITKKQFQHKMPKLRNNIVPGTVLILLAGKFRGKRVVFLKQLDSGLLLVTGPYKFNGVPLKRVNQTYVIPTSTKVPLQGVQFGDINDDYFKCIKPVKKVKKNEKNFFVVTKELTPEQKQKQAELKNAKKIKQQSVDGNLIGQIKNIQMLKNYLSARFTLRNNQHPHLMRF